MAWFTQDNIRQLRERGVPINLTNVYGAHHFGVKGWSKIALANSKTSKWKVIPDSEVFEQNPYLKKDGIKTAGDIVKKIKSFLSTSAKRLEEKGTPVNIALD